MKSRNLWYLNGRRVSFKGESQCHVKAKETEVKNVDRDVKEARKAKRKADGKTYSDRIS